MRMLHDRELVFGLGPAGTGKTYLAVAVAVAMLTKGSVDRIISLARRSRRASAWASFPAICAKSRSLSASAL